MDITLRIIIALVAGYLTVWIHEIGHAVFVKNPKITVNWYGVGKTTSDGAQFPKLASLGGFMLTTIISYIVTILKPNPNELLGFCICAIGLTCFVGSLISSFVEGVLGIHFLKDAQSDFEFIFGKEFKIAGIAITLLLLLILGEFYLKLFVEMSPFI